MYICIFFFFLSCVEEFDGRMEEKDRKRKEKQAAVTVSPRPWLVHNTAVLAGFYLIMSLIFCP